MTRGFLNTVATHPFESTSLAISVAALLYAALAYRAAKQAIQITQESELSALRLKVQDEVSAAERSFHKLQAACFQTRAQWDRHINKHYPVLSQNFVRPKETKHVAELEKAGRALLRELKDAAPTTSTRNTAEFESFIKQAKGTAMQIEQLVFGLESPKPVRF